MTAIHRQGRARLAGACAALALLASCGLVSCGLMPPEEQPSPAEPPADTTRRALPPQEYTLVWADEFEGGALDGGRWTAASGQRRDALSTPDAVAVRDGLLAITTYTQSGAHRTGFVTTEGKFEARYGYFEARIRFRGAPGTWCAFWLAAPTIGTPLGDPGTAGVEVDVVEHRVTDQGGWDALRDMVAVGLNWDGYDANRKRSQRVVALPNRAPVDGEWHTYSVLWSATGYTFYVDEMELSTTSAAISHRPEDVRLTCEVSDASWAGDVPAAGYGPREASQTGMEVDWVRVWQAR